jgi:hypothetical protein
MPGARAPASEAGAKKRPWEIRKGKIALAPNIIAKDPIHPCPCGITPNLIIKGIIMIAAGANRNIRTSSTVKFPLTAKRVPTRNAAQILTVTSAVNTPSGLVHKIGIGMFHFLDIAHLSIG